MCKLHQCFAFFPRALPDCDCSKRGELRLIFYFGTGHLPIETVLAAAPGAIHRRFWPEAFEAAHHTVSFMFRQTTSSLTVVLPSARLIASQYIKLLDYPLLSFTDATKFPPPISFVFPPPTLLYFPLSEQWVGTGFPAFSIHFSVTVLFCEAYP